MLLDGYLDLNESVFWKRWVHICLTQDSELVFLRYSHNLVLRLRPKDDSSQKLSELKICIVQTLIPVDLVGNNHEFVSLRRKRKVAVEDPCTDNFEVLSA
jgi:hypothetical protein